jgi:adenine-specific DNA glycosylase
MLRNIKRTLCFLNTKPSCALCPLRENCSYYSSTVLQHDIGYPSIELVFSEKIPKFFFVHTNHDENISHLGEDW